ncbi:MAG: phosphatidate cytidylyltransferase [Acidimicrobiaceae bacterium]|nr:phosphatidate cytidylyltransferase [Acidimicrobiaceae bacterium]
MALGADPWSDKRRVDDETQRAEGVLGEETSSELPHWTDPPTGEIPRVLLELSSDPPLWRSSRRNAIEDDIWHSSEGFGQPERSRTGKSLRERVTPRRTEAPQAALQPPSNGQSLRSPSPSADYHDHQPLTDQGRGSNMDSRYAKESEPRRAKPEPHKNQAGANSDAADDPTRSLRSGGRHTKKSDKRSSKSGSSRSLAMLKRSSQRSDRNSRLKGDTISPPRRGYSTPGDLASPSLSSRSQPKEKTSTGARRSEQQLPLDPNPRSAVKATITGLLLGLVVIAAAALGAQVMLVLVALAVVLALIEYLELARVGGAKPIGIVAIVGALTALFGSYARGYEGIALASVLVVVFAMMWFLSGLGKGSPSAGISSTFMGFLWIGGLGSFAGLILEPKGPFGAQGPGLMLAALICTSASDVFAYAGGSLFGKHRLAPSLSPSKTQEGLAIGAVATILAGTLIVGQIHPFTMSKGFVLGLVVAIVAPIGDLAESMVKRDLGVKDSGSLLPGHGGILDRIDGVLFALPFVYYLLRLLHL